jgi:hypothetical protein
MIFSLSKPPPKDATEAQLIRKSAVRVYVTYWVVFAYSVGALGLTAYLLFYSKFDQALAVFNGFATLAVGITAFWFGQRGQGLTAPDGKGSTEGPSLIGPRQGNAKRPASENIKPDDTGGTKPVI